MSNINTYESMGKNELRAACKAAGVKGYGNMTNDLMRAALVKAHKAHKVAPVVAAPVAAPVAPAPAPVVTPVAAPVEAPAAFAHKRVSERRASADEETKIEIKIDAKPGTEIAIEAPGANVFGAMFGATVIPKNVGTAQKVIDGKKVTDKIEAAPVVAAVRVPTVRKAPTAKGVRKGYVIQKEREEKNGVKRPSEGTTCNKIWAAYDAEPEMRANKVAGIAEKNNWDAVTCQVQFYTWRKFNGIKGRTV